MKKFLSSLVLLIAVLTLAACNGKTDDRLEITFWHAMGQSNQAVIAKMISSFEKEYPNVKVTQVSQGGYTDLLGKVKDNIKAGTGPVLAQTYPDHVVSYLTSKGAVVDLNNYAFDTEVGFDALGVDENQYVKSFWDEGYKYDNEGSLYSLPFNKSTEAVYYNQTIFSKYDFFVTKLGMDPKDVYTEYNPNTINDEGKLVVGKKVYRSDFVWHPTWEQFEKIGEAFKETSEYLAFTENKEMAGALGYDSQSNLFITLTQQLAAMAEGTPYGARGEDAYVSFDKDSAEGLGEFTFLNDDNPFAKDAVRYYKGQYMKGNFLTSGALGADYCSDAFKAGKCIITVGSSAGSSYNVPSDGSFEVGVATYPQFEAATEEQKQVIQQGTNLTLFSQDDKELEKYGWLFMLHMINYDNALLWATETGYFPIRHDVYNSTKYQDYIAGKMEDAEGNVIYSPSIGAKTAKAGWQQSAWFYNNVVFNGTDTARTEIESLVAAVLLDKGTTDAEITTAINTAFNTVKDALKKYMPDAQ